MAETPAKQVVICTRPLTRKMVRKSGTVDRELSVCLAETPAKQAVICTRAANQKNGQKKRHCR